MYFVLVAWTSFWRNRSISRDLSHRGGHVVHRIWSPFKTRFNTMRHFWARSQWTISEIIHQMESFSALLVVCEGNSRVTDGFPSQRPVMRSFDVVFDLRLNKRLSKQSSRKWIETRSRSLWLHCDDTVLLYFVWFRLYHQFYVDSCDLFTHIIQGCFTGTGAIIWLSQYPWNKPES